MKIFEQGLIDLHTHSCYSDGDFKPDDLIDIAISKGIKTLSITDHDTVLGNQNVTIRKGIQIIPGIELSAKVAIGRMHILGYGIDIYNQQLNDSMNQLQTNSVNSVLSVIEQIKKDYGFIFTHEQLKELFSKPGNIGRPNIAQLCIQNGYVQTVKEAFDHYLNPAYDKIKMSNTKYSCEECIDLIIRSGGTPVLAHPNSLKMNYQELKQQLLYMKSLGLQGIEVYHSGASLEEREQYLQLSKELDLLVSGGTDYHGPSVKPDVEIGTGKNHNIKIKSLSLLDKKLIHF